MMLFRRTLLALAIPAALAYAQQKQAPTVKEAQQFLERANDRLLELAVDFSVADWIRATYITDDTD
ncbi:MAG: peptidase M2 family protein, partial [Acidobacteria bacterium]|nr:peptidase M2 family protein [Acidobacteriota bacterium]